MFHNTTKYISFSKYKNCEFNIKLYYIFSIFQTDDRGRSPGNSRRPIPVAITTSPPSPEEPVTL